jgi:tight adherence protein B
MALVLLAFVAGVAGVMGIFLGVTKLPGLMRQRKLEQRLMEVSTNGRFDEPGEAGSSSLIKSEVGGALAALERAAKRHAKGAALSLWVEQSGMKIGVGTLLAVAALAGLAGAFLGGVIGGSVVAMAAGAGIGVALPFGVLKTKRRRRLNAFEEQFPEALDLIARALKAGHAFATGLKMVADEMAEPVGPEFRKTFDEQNFGLPLKDALENLTVRIPSLDVRFFATAVLIQRETGGNLSEILENLAHVVRERFKILRQVRVHTAHGRFTGWVLLALPAFLAVALMFINPDHMNLLFREAMGRQMLIAALIMQVIGYFWIQRVIKIEV